jgi:hypothetical protein
VGARGLVLDRQANRASGLYYRITRLLTQACCAFFFLGQHAPPDTLCKQPQEHRILTLLALLVQKYLALVTRRGHSCSSRKSIAQVLGLPAAPQVSVLVKQVNWVLVKQVNTVVAGIAQVLGFPAAPQVSVLVCGLIKSFSYLRLRRRGLV